MGSDIGSALSTFSQLALGLAGFSSVLIALSGKPGSWTRVDSFRITNLLAACFVAVFMSLLPPLLAFFGLADSALWNASLNVLAAATLGIVLLALAHLRRLSSGDCAVLRLPLVFTTMTLLTLAALGEAASAWRGSAHPQGVFFAGMVVLFGFSVYLVIRFLFARPSD